MKKLDLKKKNLCLVDEDVQRDFYGGALMIHLSTTMVS